ncbi:hypothetical protein LTR10_020387 [Elasticomyces elasticus]|uniref:Inner centromere protein ARK-binding domain-containing protein n=1 Tax=Exophiala sideris TaxID=1016849 RepID=A0ABR0JLD4_9EURO|nr:hypothetical protein LTR10_020387 [Elasticomyces elasticus]KAK5036387.1 hypothetical protein LTS07_002114 [Exophiala sideris]KAK5041781.1 hypothetical protein LTR13_002448 [Exophiala sideris]KAK5066771.1 hypothetical protein LTR69_002118 [Exophiala sideris]KAK5184829.1 hypothetical protein LTR44_002675 [Eurotiomycetes sp. CCFEE 6388]
MLGARARAAEYNAFKAATARQASHEAEEQNLPPKSTPISLSAFTKNPQQNRNKGNKAWVPLVLEDTPEQESDASEESSYTISTPTRQTGTANPKSPSLSKNETPLGPRHPQVARVEMPNFPIPTAPRAMVGNTARPSFIVNPTPQRLQQHSIIKQSLRDAAISVQTSPSNMSGPSHVPMPPFNTTNHIVNVMVPEDISPTKQENKLALLSKEYANAAAGAAHQQFQQFHSPDSTSLDADSMMHYQIPYIPHANVPQMWNPFQYMDTSGQNNLQRPAIQHFNSDNDMPAHQDRPVVFRNPARVARRFSYSDTGGALQRENRDKDDGKYVRTPQSQLKMSSGDEPYDRNSKMQGFVAAQQALAKTGKTVLHNPELYRDKPSAVSTPEATRSSTTTSEHELGHEVNDNQIANRPVSILKPPPGLELLHLQSRNLEYSEKVQRPSHEDEELRNEFGVRHGDWFELKPVSKTQRIKMNKAMRLCGDPYWAESPAGMSLRTPSTRQDNFRKPTEEDAGVNKATRTLVDQIAQAHFRDRQSTLTSGDGAVTDLAASAEIETGAICAVGNIWANLIENVDSDAAEINGVSSVWKYKPAPEYAIERSRLMTSNSGSTSFFEEETGTFYNAPSRIARDPRFRPPTKEVTKSRPEDDFTRRDIFGRRRMGPT